MSWSKNKNYCERGQATMLSFSIFIVFGLMACYLILTSENAQRTSLRAIEQRHSALTNSRKTADILNQIAFNNRNILVSLAIASNAFAEAFNLAKLRYATQPPWEGRQFLVPTKRGTQEKIAAVVQGDAVLRYGRTLQRFFENNPFARNLIDIDEVAIESFETYSKRGARGLRVAAGLAARNLDLKRQLAARVSHLTDDVVIQSEFRPALCLATRFGLEQEGIKFDSAECAQTDSLWSGALLDLRGFADKWNESQRDPIGIMYVKTDKAAAFLQAIRHTSTGGPEVDERLHTFLERVAAPVFKLSPQVAPQAPQFVVSAAVNPELKLKSGCEARHGIKELISNAQWEKAIQCGVHPNSLVHAFFKPHWTPLILEFQNRGAGSLVYVR